MRKMNIFILVITLLLTCQIQRVHAGNDNADITRTISVGSPDEAALLKELYGKFPDSKPQLDEYRRQASALPYGTQIEMHIQVQDGASAINWKEVAAGAAAGLGLTLLWNAFGGELFCGLGFVPACACVGPQC